MFDANLKPLAPAAYGCSMYQGVIIVSDLGVLDRVALCTRDWVWEIIFVSLFLYRCAGIAFQIQTPLYNSSFFLARVQVRIFFLLFFLLFSSLNESIVIFGLCVNLSMKKFCGNFFFKNFANFVIFAAFSTKIVARRRPTISPRGWLVL
jgi:hypothetical protein